MINDNEKQHYLTAKKKTGHSGECCLNCLKLFLNKSSFQKHKCKSLSLSESKSIS